MAEEGVAWAWKQVAPAADLDVSPEGVPEHRWEFQHPLSGGTYRPGTAEDRGDEIVHAEAADREWTLTAVKTVALRGILREVGVANPTSTASGLSKADGAALRKVCRAAGVKPGKPTSPSADHADAVVPNGEAAGPAGGEPRALPVAPDAVQWLAVATLPVALALLVFLCRPNALPTAANWARNQLAKRTEGSDSASENQR